MLAFTLMLLAHSACPQDPAPGIDRGLAADRANLIKDVQYDLRFELSPNATEVSGEEYLAYTTEESEKLEVFQKTDELGGSYELAIKQLAESKRQKQ